MTDADMSKNSLAIRLIESAVFLAARHNDDSRSSMLRGLLTLDLVKPTRISSIELELVASVVTSWPEGIGARRVEVTEEHKVFHASTVYFRASEMEIQARRNVSIGPGTAYHHDNTWEDHQRNLEETAADATRNRHVNRGLSVDSSFFQRIPLSQEEFPIVPTPPYSPSDIQPSSPLPPPSPRVTENHPFQSPREFADYSDADPRTGRRRMTGFPPTRSPPNTRSFHTQLPLSRRPSIEGVPEGEPSLTPLRQSFLPSRSTSCSPTPPSSTISPDDNRGRRSSRFSLSSVFVDSTRTHGFAQSRESSHEDERSHLRRGRPKEKREGVYGMTTSVVGHQQSKDRSTFEKFGALFKLDHNTKEADGRWKEFKKGTYTYPVSYAIPANSSPTLVCTHGSVTWLLRATVHRPGTFTPKIVATREVLVICCPTGDDNDGTGSIVVERHWDQQLQYLILVSGRSFYIGGRLPIMFTLVPLAKVKIHQIHVFIEERIDYYTRMTRIVRTDPLTRIVLLSLKDTGKVPRPILPLESEHEDVFKTSPLCALTQPEDDISEVASSYMGPGPWTLTSNLKLPASCRRMQITYKNRRSNIAITHLLTCVIRVERGDDLHIDPKTGKRRLFDIIARTPIQILSCRCNPEWTSLPPYLESLDSDSSIIPICPCEVTCHGERNGVSSTIAGVNTHPSTIERTTTEQQCTSPSGVERSTVNLTPQNDSPFSRSSQYERLISGQESEFGEVPPTYTPVER